jgi:hypothetical protein
MLAGDPADRIAHVASIQAEILLIFPPRNFRALDGHLSQRPVQQLGVVEIGAAHGDRQRGSTAVDQQTAFAPLFFPGRSGSDRRIRLPAALCPWLHPLIATARRCRASRRIRPGQPATVSGKSPPCTSSESIDAPRWPNRTRAAMLSIECRSAERKQSPKKPAAKTLVYVQLQPCAGTCALPPACVLGSAAQPCSTNYPKQSTI